MKQLSKQECFDRALKGVASQGYHLALDREGEAAFSGQGGMRCAAGHTMSKKLLEFVVKKDLNNSSMVTVFDSVLANGKGKLAKLLSARYGKEVDADFLTDLQSPHDGMRVDDTKKDRKKYFLNNMQSVAKRYELEYKAPTK